MRNDECYGHRHLILVNCVFVILLSREFQAMFSNYSFLVVNLGRMNTSEISLCTGTDDKRILLGLFVELCRTNGAQQIHIASVRRQCSDVITRGLCSAWYF